MSLSQKAESVKELLTFCIALIPKIVDVVVELISLIKEAKTSNV